MRLFGEGLYHRTITDDCGEIHQTGILGNRNCQRRCRVHTGENGPEQWYEKEQADGK